MLICFDSSCLTFSDCSRAFAAKSVSSFFGVSPFTGVAIASMSGRSCSKIFGVIFGSLPPLPLSLYIQKTGFMAAKRYLCCRVETLLVLF